jgi:hypothetical protein
MTERKAIVLLVTGLCLLLLGAVVVLQALNASVDAVNFVYLVVLSAAGIGAGRIVVHYDDPPSKHDRR